MTGREQKEPATPTQGAAPAPFFARFLESQHGDSGRKAAAEIKSLKYPSDRDEDGYAPDLKAAATGAGPSRTTLKYPSDMDEIDR